MREQILCHLTVALYQVCCLKQYEYPTKENRHLHKHVLGNTSNVLGLHMILMRMQARSVPSQILDPSYPLITLPKLQSHLGELLQAANRDRTVAP